MFTFTYLQLGSRMIILTFKPYVGTIMHLSLGDIDVVKNLMTHSISSKDTCPLVS